MEKLRAIGARRVIMSFVGVFICAVSIGMFKFAALGVDPFQTLMAGLDYVVPISFGTLYVIVNAVLLLFALFTERHYIGIATVINLLFLGYIVKFTQDLLENLIPEPALWIRIVFLVVGIVAICLSLSLYITADLGVSTYDAVALVMYNKWKIWKFKYDRILTDIVCIIIGICLFVIGGGSFDEIIGSVGVGTVITAFFMGPLIEFFNVHFSIPLLKLKKNKNDEHV